MPTGESPTGLNVTLDTEHAEKLSQMAERSTRAQLGREQGRRGEAKPLEDV